MSTNRKARQEPTPVDDREADRGERIELLFRNRALMHENRELREVRDRLLFALEVACNRAVVTATLEAVEDLNG